MKKKTLILYVYLKNKKIKFLKILIIIIFYLLNLDNKIIQNIDNNLCEELDPMNVYINILNSKPKILCENEISQHICYQHNYSFFQIHKGVICMMKNFYINISNWKEDGYVYNGPVNKKTKGVPLINNGFFNMNCKVKNNISNFSSIYKSYFQSWKYYSEQNNPFNQEKNIEELAPGKTIFIFSRNQDSPNLLIGGAEIINALTLMKLMKLKAENIQILFLESIKINNDPYYNLYKNIISRGSEPLHIRNLSSKKIYHISKAIHIPINWDSPVFCKTKIPNCNVKSKAYSELYYSIFKYLKITSFIDNTNKDKDAYFYPKSFTNSKLNLYKKYLTIQWTKPWPKTRKGQERIFGNAKEIVEKLDSVLRNKKILIRLVDTAMLPIETQISLMQKTDYFLGIHGAGIFLSIFLPSKSIVHEIKSKERLTPNRPQIAAIISGHKVYSDFFNIIIKKIEFQETYFVDKNELTKRVIKIMKENNFFNENI